MISNSVCRAFKTCKGGFVKVWSASFFLHRLSNTFKRLWQRILNKISTESFQAYRSANPVRDRLPWMWTVITMRTFNCLKARWFSSGLLLFLSFFLPCHFTFPNITFICWPAPDTCTTCSVRVLPFWRFPENWFRKRSTKSMINWPGWKIFDNSEFLTRSSIPRMGRSHRRWKWSENRLTHSIKIWLNPCTESE